MRRIELLAPAKNLECGIAAIDHGADAVYIGPSRFGARASAGNSTDDIRQLAQYAHRFGAKVYATLNTIVFDAELPQAEQLVEAIGRSGVDAVLVQDMAVADMVRRLCPNVALHASTQTDNRTADKVQWLSRRGFSRVVLARELSVEEIQNIHQSAPGVELEAFVHGALCVSYSGACYASQHCFRRSANRGECAQFCRLAFDLIDADGHTVERDLHLLSLKDLCQIDHLEELLDAGVCSLKIEGRLKDADYVKNVVAAYSQRLNAIIDRRPNDYARASAGCCTYSFTPDLQKTFNRGYTTYFLHGRQPDIASFLTPKALGECVGRVKEVRSQSFTVAGTASFCNGDGLCFINRERKLEGFRINRVESNRLFPLHMPAGLRPGTVLYRNSDQAFSRLLDKKSADRRIRLQLHLAYADGQLALTALDECGRKAVASTSLEAQQAQKPQRANMENQLGKLGQTDFLATKITIDEGVASLFVPSSLLAQLRREAVESLGREPFPQPGSCQASAPNMACTMASEENGASAQWQKLHIDNVANHQSRDYYASQGMADVPMAPEVDGRRLLPTAKASQLPLMTCRHCLRFALGKCVRRGGEKPSWHEPLSLRLPDGRQFRLAFDCQNCEMRVYAET